MRALVVDLGAKTYAASAAAETQWGLAAATQSAREGVHGVSLDEELALMMEAQRAYEAAARVMTTVDEALDVLINRTGVVGR
jgi:flagellar hook-associated protein 1 FlgK